MKIKDN